MNNGFNIDGFLYFSDSGRFKNWCRSCFDYTSIRFCKSIVLLDNSEEFSSSERIRIDAILTQLSKLGLLQLYGQLADIINKERERTHNDQSG
jgi:hypothetical protein